MDLAAVVLAGGTAARLDGADKAGIELAGSTFLERALAATAAAGEVVVVGDAVPTGRPVTFVREDPPHGGPVAALAAGLRALAGRPDTVLVHAVDMPWVTAATYDRLLLAAAGTDGAALCDAGGRRQLVLALSHERLVGALPEDPHGCPVHVLLSGLDLVEVVGRDREAEGVDTWRDVAQMWDL